MPTRHVTDNATLSQDDRRALRQRTNSKRTPGPDALIYHYDVIETRSVVLYELNEVPWDVVDAYIARKPGCRLAQLVQTGQSVTTVIDDPVRLAPWRTWPSLHTSRLTSDHHSIDLGQDPATFEGTTLWDAAERAGLKVGMFGPMQSWPARTFKNGGFYVPDGFGPDAVTEPPTIERFQDFNLRMTRESYYSSDGACVR